MKFLIYSLLAVLLIVTGFLFGRNANQKPSDTIFHLKERVTLYQDGNKVGELYPGALLNYAGGMDEGFQKALLLMNYYEKPDSLQYYLLEKSDHTNPKFPCWNSKDVEPISNESAKYDSNDLEEILQLAVNTADYQEDFHQAIERGDTRFIGVKGFTLQVPGVLGFDENFGQKYGVKIIEGTSDSHDDSASLAWQEFCEDYARNYNELLLSHIRSESK